MTEPISSGHYSELRRSADELFELDLLVVPAISCSVDRDEYTGLEEFNEWRDGGCDSIEDPGSFGLEGDEICGAWSSDQSCFKGFFPAIVRSNGGYVLTTKHRERSHEEVHQQINLAEEYGIPLGLAVNTMNARHFYDLSFEAANSVIYSDASTLRLLSRNENLRIESNGRDCWAYAFVNFRSDDIFDWFDGAFKRQFGVIGNDCPIGTIRKSAIVPAYPSYVLGTRIQLLTPERNKVKWIITSAEKAVIHFDVEASNELSSGESDDVQDQASEIWSGKSVETFDDPEVDECGIPFDLPLKGEESPRENIDQVIGSERPERQWLDQLFPSDLANACRCLTSNLPYDETTVSMAYMTGIASLLKLGTKINGNPLVNYQVPANLFVAFIGKSGSKKTPLKGLLVDDPSEPIRLAIDSQNTRELRKWEEECRGVKKDDKPPRPVPLKIRTQDYSSESLVAILQKADEHSRSFGIFRDELNGLFKNMNRYAKGPGGDEEQLLELFDGKPFDSSRVANPRSYQRCSVSIYGNLQPRVFAKLTKDPDATGQWARFLFVPLPEKTVPLPVECSEEEQRQVVNATKLLEDYAQSAFELSPMVYKLDKEARKVFSEYEYEKQHGVHSSANETQSALHGKSAGKVLRIAGLIHILAIIRSKPNDPTSIGADVLRKAIEFVDYLDHWALSQYTSREVTAKSKITKEMRRLHNIALKLGSVVTWSQVRTCLSGQEAKLMNRMKAEDWFRRLEAMGYGMVSIGSRGGLCYGARKPLPPE